MIDKNKLIKVSKRSSGSVGYEIADLGVKRQFQPRETKEVTFEELENYSE